MRTRSLLSPVVFFGTLVLGAVGCQVIGGISGLEVKDTGSTTTSASSAQGGGGSTASQGGGGSTASQGGGGAAPTTTTSSGGGMGGMAGTGGAMQGGGGTGGMPECQTNGDCPAATACASYQCKSGKCVQTNADAGTSCGDSTDDDCKNPDTCDGNGTCVSNDEADDTKCGSGPTDCSDQDTCKSGVCQPNDKPDNTTCGDGPTPCSNQDTCKSGVCQPNDKALNTSCGTATCSNAVYTPVGKCDGSGTCGVQPVSCAPYACNANGTACNSTCSGNTDCASGNFCGGPPGSKVCQACGNTPANLNPPINPMCGPGCMGAGGTCADSATCTKSCGSANCGTTTFTQESNAIYTCNSGGCTSNTVITCQGGWGCTLVCEAGTSCDGVTLNCGEGPCTVDCKPGASCKGITQKCGNNSCTATCEGAGQAVVQQSANLSCSATKTNCN